MKKLIALMLTLAMTACLMAGCSGKSSEKPAEDAPPAETEEAPAEAETEAAADHDPVTLKFSMTATMEEHHGACWQTFADYVHEKCPWITVEIHHSSTLYDDSTFVDAIMRGNVEMGITAPGYLGEYAPEVAIFGACYIFDSVDQMNSILNGQVGSDIYEKVAEDTGIRMLGAIYKGRRTINLREDKEVKSREDLNGVLLRVPNAESWIQMGNALGATPTAMALSEVYLALQSGTIDGQDNPLQATMNYGFGEVTKSITMTNHVIDINWLCISEDIWKTFDEETKAVFMDGLQIAYDECFQAYDGEEAELIKQFQDMGVTVYEDTDMTTMKEEVWDWYWDHEEVSGGWDKDVYEAILTQFLSLGFRL